MDLRYELAYGGVDVRSDPSVPCIYARNHLGRGFVVKNTKETVDRLALPNIEDPGDLLTPDRLCLENFWEWEKLPLPAGFGWYSKYWRPRAMYAGVMPADRLAEQELRAIYAEALPPEQREIYVNNPLPSMDFRFFNGASLGLTANLKGDEMVETLHLTPEGSLQFQLPGDAPAIAIDLGHGPRELQVVLHTVMIRLEENEIDLVWRAAIEFAGPESLTELRKLKVDVR
jgi:hypothetical protein